MTTLKPIAEALAATMLRGAFVEAELAAAVTARLGRSYRFVPSLIKRVIRHFGEGRRPRHYLLQRFLVADEGLYQGCKKHAVKLQSEVGVQGSMQPISAARLWSVPPISSSGDLMRRLRLNEGELLWLADPKSWGTKAGDEALRNYRYRWMPKKSGGARLIESPKSLLKSKQRHVLHEILDHIPTHDAAHGFRAGRSICTFAAPHVQRAVVLRLDLTDFFVSIPKWRVISVFLAAGYPDAVATLLASLCTHATPRTVVDAYPTRLQPEALWRLRKRYDSPHLPQGAPTSPALANLCALHLDSRLAGLAKACGASYTRYADDLIFSGDEAFSRRVESFAIKASSIAMEEGFHVNTHKTKIMRSATSQRAAGIVVNEHLNVPRAEFDELKAILHNCLKHGANTQNRAGHADFRAHLAGRVAHMCLVAPGRGEKLRGMMARIDWEDGLSLCGESHHA